MADFKFKNFALNHELLNNDSDFVKVVKEMLRDGMAIEKEHGKADPNITELYVWAMDQGWQGFPEWNAKGVDKRRQVRRIFNHIVEKEA
jgi:hypothetical protein